MIKRKTIQPETEEAILDSLTYKSGRLYWTRSRGWRAKAGKRAGSKTPAGYRTIGINKVAILEHRVIYWLHHNEWPDYIDHIDGKPWNNDIDNLRAVTQKENMQNKHPRKRVKQKLPFGIFYAKKSAKYCANVYLGKFDTLEEAIAQQEKVNDILSEYLT